MSHDIGLWSRRSACRVIVRYLPRVARGMALAAFVSPAFADAAHFSKQQVQAGAQAFSENCAQCHGANLQGAAGPTLKGQNFASSLQYGNMSAAQLYRFIATNMPLTKPGSLSKKQYLDVFAYILSQNGFRPGNTQLTTNSLSKIDLLPFPKEAASQSK